ncbi:DUF4907 domain-containing protein [Flavobacterium foetidum]|nr:DUF4907 domain-containing protein [Flavobacterium foetidum]
MMIINKKQFFPTSVWKNLAFLILILQFTACAKKDPLQTASFKTNSGWGYSIAYKGKILIKQSIIPVINETKSFATEEDALKVAVLVKEKLKQKISPTVTEKDLILLKIKF